LRSPHQGRSATLNGISRPRLADWEFPTDGKKQIASATIAVREAANTVDAVVFYEDGSHESFSRDLENVPRKCPEVVKTQRS
jgi:hypothetical protein